MLITDVVMPETTGRVLAKTVKAARPEMKVLYISGYMGPACVENGELEPGGPLLEKPFKRRSWREEYARSSIHRGPENATLLHL